MQSRRDFLKKTAVLGGGVSVSRAIPAAIQKAFAINPTTGSTYLDAEHVVFLMQENRSFDHCFGSLQGVRGFNDPRAITLPDKNPVWLQTNAKGETFAPFRLDLQNTKSTWMGGLPHSWSDQVDARNNGRYDKWLHAKAYGHKEMKDFPMTMGYYTRDDLPFYYALADAFTICDQHFCSSLAGTTPNRLFFWSGTLREDARSKARVWNSDTDYDANANWTTFPERLEENGISWRIYQNELSVGAGFSPEEDAWLANFTDNPLEWFEQYHVKLSAGYIAYLQKAPRLLATEMAQLAEKLLQAGRDEKVTLQKQLNGKKKMLERVLVEQKIYTPEKYEQLTATAKNLHNKAFTTNRLDANYQQLTSLRYNDGPIERELVIPKGDVLHQFRSDVNEGKLPTVSWLVAPEKFSDHPSAPWFGAWYVSEVLDILTHNPEIWKKTIFVLTYDENDGYFDHVPPFVAPRPQAKETGATSAAIDTSVEYASFDRQHPHPDKMRESPVGLGYRVPMIVASPWSRGGWVNSQVFDHTSSLQFLESFLAKKFGKDIREHNISDWRRCVCGDLRTAFRPYQGEKISFPKPVGKEAYIESIHKLKFKQAPHTQQPLSTTEIAQAKKDLLAAAYMPLQEKGTRPSCGLPYELHANGGLSEDRKSVKLTLEAGTTQFGEKALGSPFQVYAPGNYQRLNKDGKAVFEPVCVWDYAVKAGDMLTDQWNLQNFENGQYFLRVYGPNGFFREFSGTANDPQVAVTLHYEKAEAGGGQLTGNIVLSIQNLSKDDEYVFEIADANRRQQAKRVALDRTTQIATITLDLAHSANWYDISLLAVGYPAYTKKYAGRVETGQHGTTDPYMGGLLT